MSKHIARSRSAREAYFGVPEIPLRALAISLAAVAVPVLRNTFFYAGSEQYEALLWLLVLIPAFLLSYYRGWRGSLLALAGGMTLLVLVQLYILLTGSPIHEGYLLGAVVVVLLAVGFGIGYVTELLHKARADAEDMAFTDDLTQLPNRRLASAFLEKEFGAAQRGRPLVVALFDIDNFKGVNDQYGHELGDDVLRRVADILDATTRTMNLSCRWGGEEFLSILSASDIEGATVFAERVRERVAALEGLPQPISISAGLAAFSGSTASSEDLVAAADAALLEAKRTGKDRVCVAVRAGVTGFAGSSSRTALSNP